jgi:hypothetical protein
VLILRIAKGLRAIHTHAHTMEWFTEAIEKWKELAALPMIYIDTNRFVRKILQHEQILAPPTHHRDTDRSHFPGATFFTLANSLFATRGRASSRHRPTLIIVEMLDRKSLPF